MVPREIPASAPFSGAYWRLTHAMAIVLLGESLSALQGGRSRDTCELRGLTLGPLLVTATEQLSL